MNLILINPDDRETDGRVVLAGVRSQHIRKVLKAAPGQRLKIGRLNGPKGEGEVIRMEEDRVVLQCTWDTQVPLPPRLDLLLAMPRPKVMNRLWAQLAALGVGKIHITNAERVERFYFDTHVLDPDHYRPRLMEGLQQAGDTRLPEVRIHRQLKPLVEDVLGPDYASGQTWFAHPGPTAPLPAFTPDQRSLLAIGPEGGWIPYEVDLFEQQGFSPFGMGPRILRADTACVAAISRFQVQQKEP